jgi:hypothetical protein
LEWAGRPIYARRTFVPAEKFHHEDMNKMKNMNFFMRFIRLLFPCQSFLPPILLILLILSNFPSAGKDSRSTPRPGYMGA